MKVIPTYDIDTKGSIVRIDPNTIPLLCQHTNHKESQRIHGSGKEGTESIGGSGHNWKDTIIVGADGRVKRLVEEVRWRPLQLRSRGIMDIVIFSPRYLSECEISMQIGLESVGAKGHLVNGPVSIIDCNRREAVLKGLAISNVTLRGGGRNIIRIKFSDHMNHIMDIAVYEYD